jgi:glycosyltransferase involved in cell wall biosynthesis
VQVTVAICTWNRCELLQRTLESLTKTRVPSSIALDLVVVNNNCTDATEAVVEQFRGRLPLRQVLESQPGVTHARNTALAAAIGEYVLFTDDDVLVDESWLVEFDRAIRAYPEAAAIGGVIEPWFPQEPDRLLFAAFPMLQQGFCGLDHHRPAGLLPAPLPIWTANAAYRVAALQGIRFDPRFGRTPTSEVTGEETDLLRRVREAAGTVVWWPRMRVLHYVGPERMTLPYLLRFTRASGTQHVLRSVPDSSRCYFGVPRWLWHRLAWAYLHYLMSPLSAGIGGYPEPFSGAIRQSPDRSRRALQWRREVHFLRGMVEGYRAERGRQGLKLQPVKS